MYLKDLSPYLRQFLPYSDSQNIIGVNLLGKYSIVIVIDLFNIYTYIPSLLIGRTVVFPTPFRYTITTTVTVEDSKLT